MMQNDTAFVTIMPTHVPNVTRRSVSRRVSVARMPFLHFERGLPHEQVRASVVPSTATVVVAYACVNSILGSTIACITPCQSIGTKPSSRT